MKHIIESRYLERNSTVEPYDDFIRNGLDKSIKHMQADSDTVINHDISSPELLLNSLMNDLAITIDGEKWQVLNIKRAKYGNAMHVVFRSEQETPEASDNSPLYVGKRMFATIKETLKGVEVCSYGVQECDEYI